MNVKNCINMLRNHYLTRHLAAMALVVIVLCIVAGYGLDLYTFHGENIPVPNLQGMAYENAAKQLKELNLIIQVNDSGYNKQQPANTILAQTPDNGTCVKRGHIIYVTVNSPSSPTFTIPDIIDNSSVREAEARLTAMGFKLTQAQLVDGEKDWVYGIVCRGRQISNGDRISVDYPLTLMVGQGTQDDMNELGIVDDGNGEAMTGGIDDFEEVQGPPANH